MRTLRSLSPGLIAIAAASAILLLSDLPKAPKREAAQKTFRVALLQISSQPIMDEGAQGVIAGLAEAGFEQGTGLELTRFNAEGDVPTANAIAREIASPRYDLVITLSTSCLQAVANANKKGDVRHVFGMVSDPVAAGVGIGDKPAEHPAHLTGLGTLPPADQSFQMAREAFPGLKRVGVVWNPGEVNSEVATKMARKACGELKIELLEANSETTAGVREAAASLLTRDVEALWVGGDVVALGAIDVLVTLARQQKIPVFTCMPGNTPRGTLFDVGANYGEVGRKLGLLAGRVLKGDAIKSIPWERAIPPKVSVNVVAIEGLKSSWKFPDEMVRTADSVVDASGEKKKLKPSVAKRPNKMWKLRMLSYINSIDSEDAERGVKDGIQAAGLQEGRDFDWKSLNAQGDIATLNGLAEAAVSDEADLILTVSTQALQAATKRGKNTPIVFTMVANPFMAGVAKSDTDHLPSVTGAYGSPDSAAMMTLIRQLLPQAFKLGTLYAPAEVNSVFNHDKLAADVKKAGYSLMSTGVGTSSEVPDAAQALCGSDIEAICLTNSNLAGSCFPSIAQATRRTKTPVFGFLAVMAEQGAVLVLARDYYEMGRDSGTIAAQVIGGESVSKLPLHETQKNRLLINLDAAKASGITIPADIVRSADKVIGR